MYKLLLILKYLRKRRIAWVSLVAVMLCTAMVLVVISIMGGWLRMFRESFNGISGDVLVDGESLVGFPYYDEMIAEIKKLPDIKGAVPVITSPGLININNQLRKGVEIVGYTPDIGTVNAFPQSLHRRKNEKELSFRLRDDVRYRPPPEFEGDVMSWDGMIVGGGVVGFKKNRAGEIQRNPLVFEVPVDLTVLPMHGVIDLKENVRRPYWIVDDSRTKVHIYDSIRVYVPFDVIQKDLEMDGSAGGPKRTSEIQIALKPGADLQLARDQIEAIVNAVRARHPFDTRYPVSVETWEQTHATFIGAVEKEKGLVTILFAIISVVAIFLIFCIFYMIVIEKTRDIGIIKSVGATGQGVAGIFLGYGLCIGLVGALMGLLIGFLIVRYINKIHDLLGTLTGAQVWNPEVYLFDTIPNTMNTMEVIIIVSAAIVSAVLGSLIPAVRAAQMHPIEALRWE